jgi:hypothetical protein
MNCTRGYYYHFYAKELLEKYDYIETITEIAGWEGNSSELPPPFAFDIKMENGKRVFLSYVESNKEKNSIYYPKYVELMGNYVINGRIPIELIVEKTGLDLRTVEDVVVNYDTIYSFVSTMTKLGEINALLSKNNKYHVNDYGIGYVGGYEGKVKSFIYNNGDICHPLLVEMDKYPEFSEIRYINEEISWEIRIVYRRSANGKVKTDSETW